MRIRWGKLGGTLGIVYCLAGLFLVFLGWNGAATYDNVPAQFPYLISGGITGLCLVVIGTGLILAQSQRADRMSLQASIAELQAAVERMGAAEGVGSAVAVGAGAGSVAAGAGDTVVAGSSAYHRATCKLVEGQHGLTPMVAAAAVAAGLTACRVCDPDGAGVAAAS